MAGRNTIRVAEFERLYYDENKPFKQKHWEALGRYQEKCKTANNGSEYYKILSKGIAFTNYVGVIQAGDLTIEILPKTDKERTTAINCTIADLESSDKSDAYSRKGWHNVLLQMMKECRLLQINHVDNARLNMKANSILEIYLELFVGHAEKLLHEGLIRKYKKEEGNRMTLKGKMIFAKNTSQNLVHRERFYVQYTEYRRENIYNQIIYKTLLLISSISNNPNLSDKVNRLLLDFPEMPDCKVTATTFDKLSFDRKTERYREAILISKMLLLNYRPDITSGNENVIAILFDMNELWEEFIFRRILKASINELDIKVTRQNKKPFWFNSRDNYHKNVKPDIVIQKKGNIYILDTKWKIVEDSSPDDGDLKQLFVYNLLWNATESFLVYPGKNLPVKGSYLHFNLSELRRISKDELFYNHCSMLFVNPINVDGVLNPDIGIELLTCLEQKISQ